VIDILDRKIALLSDQPGEELEKLWFKQGHIYMSALDDPHSAITSFLQLLVLNSEHIEAIQVLHQLYRQIEDFNALYLIIQDELILLQEEDQETQLSLSMELCELEQNELNKPTEAIERLNELLQNFNQPQIALETLETFLEDRTYGSEAAEILRPIYEANEQWASLCTALEVILNDLVEPDARLTLLERLGDIQMNNLGDLTSAQSAYTRLLQEQPEHEHAIQELYKMAEVSGNWDEFCEVFERAIGETGQPELAISRLELLAQTYENQLGQIDESIDTYKRILAYESQHLASLVKLEMLFKQQSDWDSLLNILRTRAEIEDNAEPFLIQITQIQEELLDHSDEAIAVHQEILQTNPEREESIRALCRLFEKQEQWVELTDVLENLRDRVSEEEQLQIALKLALIYEQSLGRFEQALEYYEKVLDTQPHHPEVSVALERLLNEPDFKGKAATLLTPIYEVNNNLPKLIASYQIRAEVANEVEDQIEYLHKMAELYLQAQAVYEAFETYAYAFVQDPSVDLTVERFHNLADHVDNGWPRVIEIYEQILGNIQNSDLLIKRSKAVASLYLTHQPIAEQALHHFEVAFKHDEEDSDVLDALENLYPQLTRWEEYVDLMKHRAQLREDTQEKKDDLFRASEVLENELHDLERAIETYLSIVEIDDQDVRAITALVRIYIEQERWPEAVDVLRMQERITEDLDKRKEIYYLIATTYEDERLDDLARAVETYQTILSWDEKDFVSLDRLEHLYRLLEDWDALKSVLDRQIQWSEGEEQRGASFRLGYLYQTQLDQLDLALECYQGILEQSPTHENTLSTLEEWVIHDLNGQQAADVLSRVLRSTHSYERLIQVWHHQRAITSEPEEIAQLWFDTGLVYQDILHDDQKAFESYTEVLKTQPNHSSIYDRLLDLAPRLEMWPLLLDTLLEAQTYAQDDLVQITLHLRTADLYEKALARPHEAIEQLRSIQVIDPENEDALIGLERLLEIVELWTDLSDILRTRIHIISNWDDDTFLQSESYKQVQLKQAIQSSVVSTPTPVPTPVPTPTPTPVSVSEEQSQMDQEDTPLPNDNMVSEDASEVIQAEESLSQGEGDSEGDDFGDEASTQLREHSTSTTSLEESGIHDPLLTPTDVIDVSKMNAVDQDIDAHLFDPHSEDAMDEDDLADSTSFEGAELNQELNQDEDSFDPNHALHAFEANVDAESTPLPSISENGSMNEESEESEVYKESQDVLARHQTPYIQDLADQDLSPRLALQTQLLMKLAHLCTHHLVQIENAIEVYQEVFEIKVHHAQAITALQTLFAHLDDPTHLDLIAGVLRPIYEEQNEWSLLFEQDRTLLSYQPIGEDRLEAMKNLALIALDRLNDLPNALMLYGEAFKEMPDEDECRSRLHELALEHGYPQQLLEYYAAAQSNTQDLDRLCTLSGYMAVLFIDQFEDWSSAEQQYVYMLQLNPIHLPALEGLDRVFVHQDRWEDLEGILRQEIDLVEDDELLLDLTWRLAELYENQLGNPTEAINQYNEVLAINGQHQDALNRLEALYDQTQDAVSLFDIYTRQSELSEGNELVLIQKRMAHLAAHQLERPLDSIELWTSILEQYEEDDDALNALEILYEQEEDWRELINICERRIQMAHSQVDLEIVYYGKLGRIWGECLERNQNALDAWNSVLERDPQSIDARWAMRRLYVHNENYQEAIRVDLELLDLLTSDDERCADVYHELGRLYEEQEQTDLAIQAWADSLLTAPGHSEAIERLLDLYEQNENWEAYIDVLKQKIEYTSDIDDQIPLLYHCADLHETRLDQASLATQDYQYILSLKADEFDAFDHLERLYRILEMWAELIQLLGQRVELNETIEERQEIYCRIADIYEEQDAKEDALTTLVQAFAANPDDELFGERLERLSEATGHWEHVLEYYIHALNQVGIDQPESIPLHLRCARWCDIALNNPERAVNHYNAVQVIEPENVDVFVSLELLYEKYEYWPFVVQMLEQRIPLILETDDLIAAWRKLAQVRHHRVTDLDGAVLAYSEVMDLYPEDLETLSALKDLYGLRQEFHKLIDVIEQENDLIEEIGLKVDNYLQIAELKEVRLNDPQGAIFAYHEAHELDANCADALYSLEILYKQSQDWFELQRVYENLLLARTDSQDQLNTYSKLARLQIEHLHDRTGAIDSYRKMFHIDPEHTEAISELDRLYREEENWEDLKHIYDQYLERVESPEQHTPVRIALSELSQLVFMDVEQAIEYLKPILTYEPEHQDTLYRLSTLYAATEQWVLCLEMMQSEVRLLNNVEDQAERLYQMGMIYSSHLDDPEQAIYCFKQLLDLTPTHTPALLALKEVYERKGEYRQMIQVLNKMEAQTKDYKQKSACYYEMGRIYSQLIGDTNTGIDYYQQAIDLDPENVDAAPYLVDFYLRDERWARAEPLLDLILTQDIQEDPIKTQQYHYQLGLCAQNLRKDHKALDHYKKSYRLDSTHYPTLKGLADLHLRHEEWDEAANTLQTILIHYSDKFETEERVDILFKQGKAKFQVGDFRRALDLFSRVIELDTHHPEALSLLIETYDKREKWEDSIFYRKRRIETIEVATERFEEWMAVASMYEEHLSQAHLAIEAYQEALQLNEGSKRVFGRLLPLYEHIEDWESTVNLLSHFAMREEDNETKAKYFFAIGSLQRDQFKDQLQAVRSFDKALDANPLLLKAFSAIEELLTQERNFERQDRYFRKMLKRANDHNLSTDMIFELAKALGEINRTRLGRYKEAIKAYNIALSKKPDDLTTHEIIAELYDREEMIPQAIAQHREILKRDIRQMSSFHKLFRLYISQQAYDEAWCVAQALVYLRHVKPDEKEFFDQHYSRALTEIRKPLEHDQWICLKHGKKSHLMDQLFECLYRYNAPVMTRSHQKDFGVHKRKGLISPKESTAFNRVFEYISRITQFERLSCYFAPSGVSGLRAMNTQPSAVLVGQDMTRSVTQQVLAFSIAKTLYLMTPHALMSTLDLDYDSRRNRLMMIIFTLMKMAGVEVAQFDDRLLDVYKKISPIDARKLSDFLQEMQDNPRIHLDVSRWLEGLDHTANRLGFLMCNDLSAAAQAIRNESIPMSKVSVSDRIKDLVLFSISDEYFQLRKSLGMTIRTR
jgi:tetratricopeptide (TPR) repeat protein